MGDFFESLTSKFDGGIGKRYGIDRLGVVLLVLAAILGLLALLVARWIGAFALFALVVAVIRMLSGDLEARQRENRTFVRAVAGPDAWLRLHWAMLVNHKTKAYVACPSCGTYFALPKGKGRVRATCPHCHEKSVHTV